MITREFVLAGRAVFTVSNGRGEHYTYRVTMGSSLAFVAILVGPDNERSYRDLARISPTTGKLIGEYGDDVRAKVLAWAIRRIWLQDGLPSGYEINHAGKCGRCGRTLTTPESIKIGFGPECRHKI